MQGLLRHTSRFLTAIILTAMLFIPVSPTFEARPHLTPTTAEAGGAVVVVGGMGTIQETISAGYDAIVAGLEFDDWYKEYVLDPFVWALTDQIIAEISSDMIDWANRGFSGSPSFMTNYKNLLTNAADRAAGEVFQRVGLGAMCEPFKFNVEFALQTNYYQARDKRVFECSLSGVVQNMENFLAGDFLEGGWDGWFQLTQVPENNPYGALALAQQELLTVTQSAQDKQTFSATLGRGFLNFERCEDVPIDEIPGAFEQVCTSHTPGSVIETQLNESLDLGNERLVIADEFSEVLGAVASAFLRKVLQDGLLDASEGDTSLTSERRINATGPGGQIAETLITDAEADLAAYITAVGENVDIFQQMVDFMSASNTQCDWSSTPTGEPPEIPAFVDQALEEAVNQLTEASAASQVVAEIRGRYEAAGTSQEKLAIAQEFINLQATGVLKGDPDIVQAAARGTAVLTQFMQYYNNELKQYCEEPPEIRVRGTVNVTGTVTTTGGGGGGGTGTIGTYPPGSIENLIQNMQGPEEGAQSFGPDSQLVNPLPPSDGVTMAGWGMILSEVGGGTTVNTRVAVQNLVTYVFSRSQNAWIQVVNFNTGNPGTMTAKVYGQGYCPAGCDLSAADGKTCDCPDAQSNIRVDGGGVVSATVPNDFYFQPWGFASLPIAANDVVAAYSAYEVKLVLDNPNGPDNRAGARLIANAGFDWHSPFRDGAASRWIRITNDWRTISVATMGGTTYDNGQAGSVPNADWWRQNPPPGVQ